MEMFGNVIYVDQQEIDNKFMEAIQNHDLKSAESIFLLGVENISKVIEWAAKEGNLDLIKFLVRLNGGKVPDKFELVTAAKNGHIEIVEFLIDSGCTLPYMAGAYAIDRDDVQMLKSVISRLNNRDKIIEMFLDSAVIEGSLNCLKFLVETGVRKFDKLWLTAVKYNHIDVMSYLFNRALYIHETPSLSTI